MLHEIIIPSLVNALVGSFGATVALVLFNLWRA